MPIYVYETLLPDGTAGDRFEWMQKMSAPPLTEHPESGEPVRRVITAPNIGGMWNEGAMSRRMKDDKKLDELGFTKYVKSGDGVYEKRAGKGPDTITRDQPIKGSDLK